MRRGWFPMPTQNQKPREDQPVMKPPWKYEKHGERWPAETGRPPHHPPGPDPAPTPGDLVWYGRVEAYNPRGPWSWYCDCGEFGLAGTRGEAIAEVAHCGESHGSGGEDQGE